MVYMLFTTPAAGKPMQETNSVEVRAGRGIVGDRYAEGTGLYSGGKERELKIRHITFISIEAIYHPANRNREDRFTPRDTRRNVVTRGVDLNAFVDREFRVNGIPMRGVEPCDPCDWPSRCSGKKGFKKTFKGRGGLRAEVLGDGTISAGDSIEVPT
jgi:MOSC domain-containing protein YiiM